MPTILILLPHYLPGTRYGGPVRTIQNLSEHLGHDCNLFILCLDRDFGSVEKYGLAGMGWRQQGLAQVRYVTKFATSTLAQCLDEIKPDAVLLNSLFHPEWTLRPLLHRRLKCRSWPRTILAPRGELNPGALAIKSLKKRAWLGIANFFGIYSGIEWLATNPSEASWIKKHFGKDVQLHLAPNLCAIPQRVSRSRKKTAGELRILFLGRVSPIKNLAYILQRLSSLPGQIALSICGTLEDENYVIACRAMAKQLGPSVTVDWHGEVRRDRLPEIMADHDVLFLPSEGENFGHAIAEALQHGLPVLISDQTPWQNLVSRKAGWDIPLAETGAFHEVLSALTEMDETEWLPYSEAAAMLGREISDDKEAVIANRAALCGNGT